MYFAVTHRTLKEGQGCYDVNENWRRTLYCHNTSQGRL